MQQTVEQRLFMEDMMNNEGYRMDMTILQVFMVYFSWDVLDVWAGFSGARQMIRNSKLKPNDISNNNDKH